MTTWIVLRAAGIGAYVALFLSVAWGLVATTSVVTRRVSKPTSTLFHRFISTVSVVLLGVHIGGVLLDRWMVFTLPDLLLPLRASYRPVAIAAGILAMYGTVIVLVSSWVKRWTSTRFWRALHVLAVPAFTLSLVHGLFAGTDSAQPWMWPIYAFTGSVTLFLVLVRTLTYGYRPERAPAPARVRQTVEQPTLASR
ncbi:MAG: ferric reductase-like transmembrane domain-containing protein [Actinobacteria bacterium]|nr:ferric reductase-like transmembrane domain-containing protein [Actinomycetota bacterium]